MVKGKEEFAVGTIVKLKSGGPDMTVQTSAKDGYLYAQWFAGKKLEQGRFPVNSLEEVPSAPKAEG
ncbi:DUF2158 domain-containing protein [Methylomonas sp. OY6]|uniref:DUF2158 domain-containing protein n=1 Tax=Methylomonas defluvii TaxID=3045149 RepID=A0ABU4UFU1_9GAMM|nr:DUF2158 domain-containing protein [Methylomonas sp. OY6]MDX8127978.1 DUF2158 domain-containing protein [Methylomonas sp. OY6]